MRTTSHSPAVGVCHAAIRRLGPWLLLAALGPWPLLAEDPLFEYRTDHQYAVKPELVRYRQVAAYDVPLSNATCLAAWPDGRTLIAGPGSVVLLNSTGTLHRTVTLPDTASVALAAASNGFYLATLDRVLAFNPHGVQVAAWESLGETARITGLAASGDQVWVCDAGQRRVWRYDTEGRLLGMLPPPDAPASERFIVPSPAFAVAAAGDGTFWVVNPGRLQLQHHDREGRVLSAWEAATQNPAGFVGCCNPAWLACLPDGRLVTSEKLVPRVKTYTPKGVLDAFVAPPGVLAGSVARPVAADGAGRIYVLDERLLRVYRDIRSTP